MGTNYYTRIDECDKCGRFETIHLGKSSVGWQFTFQYNGAKYYCDVPSMREWLKDKIIKDEYGKEVPHEAFWQTVEAKQGGQRNEWGLIDVNGYDFIDSNFS